MDTFRHLHNHMQKSPSPSQAENPIPVNNNSSMSAGTALLTPQERYAFDSFLNASIEPAENEFQLYTQLGIPIPLPSQNSSLAKATKELISLHPPPKYPLNQSSGHLSPTTSNLGGYNTASSSHHRPIAPAPHTITPHPLDSQNLPQARAQTQTQPPPLNRERPPKRVRRSHSPTPNTVPLSSSSGSSKPSLLTSQQKKANHIQSEQKRRANIRKGYEALCETIPALREAIKAEDEAAVANGVVNGKRRRARDEGAEKVDGRAGPRSESVVLQKTIDHIHTLLQQKSSLMSRLEKARGLLGPGHPLLSNNAMAPLWEREWDGGKGIMVDINGNEIKADMDMDESDDD